MSGKQLTKNYIYLIISQISVNLLQLITVPYVSRVLEPEGIGIYSYAVAIMTYFSMFGTLGLNYYSQVEIAKQNVFFLSLLLFYCLILLFLFLYLLQICLIKQYLVLFLYR